MKKKTKTVISLLIIIPVIISLSVGVHIAGIYKNLEGKPSQLVWNENDKYNIDKDAYILTVDEKSDFKILNLTDLQVVRRYVSEEESIALMNLYVNLYKKQIRV